MLEYWENLGFKKAQPPGGWEILKNGGGLCSPAIRVLSIKTYGLISLNRLP